MTCFLKRRPKTRMGTRDKQRDLRHPGHLQWVRGHACCVSDCPGTPIEAAHYDGPIPDAERGGMSVKNHDKWAIPMCAAHHREYHARGWRKFDGRYGMDTREVAETLQRRSPHRHRWITFQKGER